MDEELQEVTTSDWSTYNPGDHQTIKQIIKNNVNNAFASMIANGYYLNIIYDRKYYKDDGYSGIGEYAEATYGIKSDKCSYLMRVARRFCIPGSPALLPEYRGFKLEKLREMSYLTDEQLEQVTIATTRAEIREIRKPDPEPEKVTPAQLEPLPKVCKYDGKSNCVAVCNAGADCCAECINNDSCNTSCGWQEERIPKEKSIPNEKHEPIDFNRSLDSLAKECEAKSDCPPGQTGCARNWKEEYYDRTKNGPHPDCIKCWKEWLRREKIKAESKNDQTEIVDIQPEKVNDVDESVSETGEFVIEDQESDIEQVETVEADIVQTVPEEAESTNELAFNQVEIAKELLKQKQERLNDFIRLQTDTYADRKYIESRKVEVCALAVYIFEAEQILNIKPVQPELPILKNNDQRKDWIDSYNTWLIWTDQKNTGERYYRYDFDNGESFVIRVSLYHSWEHGKHSSVATYGKEEYYIIQGKKNNWEPENKTFCECSSNKSAMIEYLKDLQKKGD